MPDTSLNGTPQLADGFAGCLLDGLVTSEGQGNRETVEQWIAILTQLADDQDRKPRAVRDFGHRHVFSQKSVTDESARELRPSPPLQKVEAGPWRSLGGYFDYSLWPDRDRFLELDRAIAAMQDAHEEARAELL